MNNDEPNTHRRSRVRVSVGQNEGMFRGRDHFAIQGAVDYVARLGGGVVEILKGEYRLRDAIRLPDNVILKGAVEGVILKKGRSALSMLTEDQDWYHHSVTLADSAPFEIGDGLFLESKRLDGGTAMQVSRHTVIAKDGVRLWLDTPPVLNHWLRHEARAVSTHSLIEARSARKCSIHNLILDGSSSENETLDGNFGAAIYLYECQDIRIQNVRIQNFNGDGISWQSSHDVTVEGCELVDVRVLALHPGSGSQSPVMRKNKIHGCETGIYWCWGISNGLAEQNEISACRKNGISIGHRDVLNTIAGNRVSDCAAAAIFFRPERGREYIAHRNRVCENIIFCGVETPGPLGISLPSGLEGVILKGNVLHVPKGRENDAIVIEGDASGVISEENTIRPLLNENLPI